MATFVIIISLIGLLVGVALLLIVRRGRGTLGILNKSQIYSDTQSMPGKVMKSKKLPLVGKPDYLIKDNGLVIPVEIKTGLTPKEPHESHVMQLMAYCYLVEEIYGTRPPGGYLKYPDREFKIRYTNEAISHLEKLVFEIIENKQSGQEFHCNHKNHYI
jgi:CRISPR-associated exonuclease Cas4